MFHTDYFECQRHFGSRTYICMLCVFQFTLPPTTLGLCQHIFRCLQGFCHKGGFWIIWQSFMTNSFQAILRKFHSSDIARFQKLESLIQAVTSTIFFWIDFQIHHVFTSMQSRPDSLRLVGRYQPSVEIHLQWNNHWSCFCRLQTFPADENRCGGPSASAVSSSDMSREVLCICMNTYVGICVMTCISLYINVALSFKCKSL